MEGKLKKYGDESSHEVQKKGKNCMTECGLEQAEFCKDHFINCEEIETHKPDANKSV